ncbi:MAG: asparagine synthetase B, partial [Myxococcota bacterium]
MCGIAGAFSLEPGHQPDPRVVEAMSLALAHRGPDGAGQWSADGVVLGHRRLAIIDLEPRAAQPMHFRDADLTVVFNGEIYNFQALKNALQGRGHRFTTTSDTEVLLHGYAEYGRDLFPRLRGMYALAIYDGRRAS